MSNGIYNSTGYHNRQSIRLRGYDYSRPGLYFVTQCIHDRNQDLFGKVHSGYMHLNELGECVKRCWQGIAEHFPGTLLDEFIVMPNHLHGVIIITESTRWQNTGGRDNRAPTDGRGCRAPTLGQMVGWFSYQSTKQINIIRAAGIGKLWQRGFYDRIIRDPHLLIPVRNYIRNNPLKWELDKNNAYNADAVYVSTNPPELL